MIGLGRLTCRVPNQTVPTTSEKEIPIPSWKRNRRARRRRRNHRPHMASMPQSTQASETLPLASELQKCHREIVWNFRSETTDPPDAERRRGRGRVVFKIDTAEIPLQQQRTTCLPSSSSSSKPRNSSSPSIRLLLFFFSLPVQETPSVKEAGDRRWGRCAAARRRTRRGSTCCRCSWPPSSSCCSSSSARRRPGAGAASSSRATNLVIGGAALQAGRQVLVVWWAFGWWCLNFLTDACWVVPRKNNLISAGLEWIGL